MKIARIKNLNLITMNTAKDLFYIFSMLASTAFSLFMMYSMYKTKKGVEKIADTTQKFTEELGSKINSILPSLGIGLEPINEQVFLPISDEDILHWHKQGFEDIKGELYHEIKEGHPIIKSAYTIGQDDANEIEKYEDLNEAYLKSILKKVRSY